jgi:hypothetical protein
MKNTLTSVFLISCLALGCKQAEKAPKSLAGVYKLEKQKLTGGKIDTTYQRKQIKIFTDKFFMYAGMAPDSSVGFGVGSYSLDTGNRVVEHNIYSSARLDSVKEFDVMVTQNDKGYSQIIPDMLVSKGVKYKLTEDYSKLPAGDTSKLDGLWKLDKAYIVKGKDTTKQANNQYKIYWGGHFMFIHRYPLDKAGTRFKNGFGEGKFSIKDNTVTEEEEASSHKQLVNHKFSVDITFNGPDEYAQVITDDQTHEESTEIYKRLK